MALETVTITDADGVERKITVDLHDTDAFAQVLKLAFAADGVTPSLVASGNPLPIVDAAVATALASLLTELGQKLEPGGEVALNPATLAALETIQVGNSPADPATQTTLAALLTELGQKLEPADLAALATAAKQDAAKTVLDAILADSQAKADLSETQPVSAATLPLPSGASTSAKQDTAQTRLDLLASETKLEAVRALLAATLSVGLDAASLAALESITIGTALPAGSNAIGKLAANSGVDIGDVDVTSLPALPAGSNSIGTVDLAGSTPVQFLDVDETEDEVKGSAGKLHSLFLANLSAGVRYVKLYDETAASCDVGTDTPKATYPLAAGEKFVVSFPRGLSFGTGICIAATTALAVADTGAPGANDVVASVSFS